MHVARHPILPAVDESSWKKMAVPELYPGRASSRNFPLARGSSNGLLKRMFDLAAAALGLCAVLPLLVLCAAALWLEDRGPVFYCQRRVGRDLRCFTLYKFRTMRGPVDGTEPGLYTRDDDGRVMRVGRWLRRMRLDELPQLLNVLRGDMSLIGPRAEWDRCVEIYEREILGYHLRHSVRPGITGWAQVNYPYGRSVADTVEKLAYDLYYIQHHSFLLDASIVLRTLWVMLSFRGK
jgi:lipopolysaccharide/colanic/teichoic acid biosynthesis glycosyltransferase